jgi:alpha-L-rhamnosidase
MSLLKRTKYITGKKEKQTADWLSMEKYEAWRRGWGSKFAENPFWQGETDEDMRRYWNFLGACYRIMDLRMMCEMGKAIGRDATVAAFAAEEKEAVAEFRKKHLDADGLAPKFLRGMQTPALFLIRLGLLKSPADVKRTADEFTASLKADGFRPRTGFLGTTILLDTLVDELNDSDLAYSVLLQRGCPGWLYSVDQGATTIWERWNGYTKEKGFGPVAMNSFNHYAYGAVMGWMYRTMAGIRPGENGGYHRFVLAPHPDKRIGFCSAEYRTRHGVVKSSWRYNADGTLSCSFTVPEGTTATLRLPGMPEKNLTGGVHEMTVR